MKPNQLLPLSPENHVKLHTVPIPLEMEQETPVPPCAFSCSTYELISGDLKWFQQWKPLSIVELVRKNKYQLFLTTFMKFFWILDFLTRRKYKIQVFV
jgi:hypothetical protein